jgi:hypothetical protein
MADRLSGTEQWMKDHPNDAPCPSHPDLAHTWRVMRNIGPKYSINAHKALVKKYEAAMAEKRAHEAAKGTQ